MAFEGTLIFDDVLPIKGRYISQNIQKQIHEAQVAHQINLFHFGLSSFIKDLDGELFPVFNSHYLVTSLKVPLPRIAFLLSLHQIG